MSPFHRDLDGHGLEDRRGGPGQVRWRAREAAAWARLAHRVEQNCRRPGRLRSMKASRHGEAAHSRSRTQSPAAATSSSSRTARTPAVDSPTPGGLDADGLAGLLRGLLHLPGAAGLEITILDPDLDQDGAQAALIVDILASALV